MEYRQFGTTGLRVSPLMLGTNVFGWNLDQQQSSAILDAFVAGGGNFIDTADVYSTWKEGNTGGESEAIIGNWLHEHGDRDKVIIATKVGSRMGADPNATGLSRQHIIAGCDASLRRLRTEYIDLYQSHQDDQATPQEETLAAFDTLVRAGKVRYIGASNFSAWRLAKALGISARYNFASYVSIQPVYNLINREEFERDLADLCLAEGVAAVTYGALSGGFLTGKYRREGPLPSSVRAGGVQRRMTDRNFAILDTLAEIAATHAVTVAQIALAWTMAQPAVTAPIASATSVEQLQELLDATAIALSADALRQLNEVSAWRAPK